MPFLAEVLSLFKVEIQQLHPNGMSHLAVFEWAFRTYVGSHMSAEVFAHLHQCSPHAKNQEFPEGMKTLRYGSVCFLPRSEVIISAKAYLNWWSNWFGQWFYYQVPNDCPLRTIC